MPCDSAFAFAKYISSNHLHILEGIWKLCKQNLEDLQAPINPGPGNGVDRKYSPRCMDCHSGIVRPTARPNTSDHRWQRGLQAWQPAAAPVGGECLLIKTHRITSVLKMIHRTLKSRWHRRMAILPLNALSEEDLPSPNLETGGRRDVNLDNQGCSQIRQY
jgi:hypothetical protein